MYLDNLGIEISSLDTYRLKNNFLINDSIEQQFLNLKLTKRIESL